MSLLPGHENMQNREVLGIDGQGHLLVDFGDDGFKRYKLFVGPSGGLRASPVPEQSTNRNGNGIDQLAPDPKPSLAKRLASFDQT